MLTCHSKLTQNRTHVGDPIDVVTGASLDTQTDFILAGPLPIRWHRNYDSGKRGMPGSLGWGQFHEFDRKLVFDLDGMRYVDSTGDSVGFPYLEYDGQTVARAGLLVQRITSRRYTVQARREPLATFEVAEDRPFAPITAWSRGSVRITFAYDKYGQLGSFTDSLGRTIRVESDSLGRLARLTLRDGSRSHTLAEYQYDSAGNLVRVLDSYGNSFQSRFDRDHRQIARIDRRGYGFHFEYDSAGRCTRAGGHDGIEEVRLKYNSELRMTVVSKREGGDWTYFYDEEGVVTRRLAPDGGIVCYNRDESGHIAEIVDPLGNITRQVFASTGAHVGKIDPLGRFFEPEETPPAALPHRVAATPAEWDWGIRDIGSAELEGMTREADLSGRVFRESFPDGTLRRWVYDANGNVTKTVDRENRTTTFEYASWNLLAVATDSLGGRVRLRYAPHERITAVIDTGHTLSEFVYDACERLSEVRRHGALKETYRYDAAGNLVAKFDGNGDLLLSLEIGPGNLPILRRLASGDVHEFDHDNKGRYLSAKSAASANVFAYDTQGRRIHDERETGGVRHVYGARGLEESVILGKFLVKYQAVSKAETIVTDPTGARHSLSAAGNGFTERRYASGVSEVSKYGLQGRCLERVRNGPGGLWSRQYQYSPEGNLENVTDSESGQTSYRHDALHRVSGVQFPGASFDPIEHDSAGNVLRMPGLSGVQLLDGNRLAAANGERFAYNARNQIATRSTGLHETRYFYDSRDFLIRIERDGQPDWTAAYDALGRRVWKQWGNGKRVEYFWDTDRLIAEQDETGRLRVYVYAEPLALVPMLFIEYPSREAEPESGQRYFVFGDQIGTPIRVENDRGEVVWAARIDPYGRATLSPANRIDFAFRFPGHHFDAETGLNYNRFRYYDPALGRYLQSDPIGVAGGLNLYGYADGNPLVRVDVRGLSCKIHPNNDPECEDCKDSESSKPGQPENEPPETPETPATTTRRKQTPGDVTFPTQEEALAEAIRRHGGNADTPYDITLIYGKNPNLRGPNGEPSEQVTILLPDLQDKTFDHHSNGHTFDDTNEHELPHYHGPNGEHISYES